MLNARNGTYSKTENLAKIFGSSLRSFTHRFVYHFAFTNLMA